MRKGLRHGAWKIALLAVLLAGFTSVSRIEGLSALVTPLGVPNAGFEAGVLDGAPTGWTVSASDRVQVVDCEGPADFAIYADAGKTVCPRYGNLMLGLGTPNRVSANQNPGINSASVTFIPDRDSISLFFRLLGVDHRGDDTFRFDLKVASTGASVGQVQLDPTLVTMPESSQGCTSTPCVFTLDSGQQDNLLDTNWSRATISGLGSYVNSTELTLSYTLTASGNSALYSWAYVDANTPPVARFEFLPNVSPAPLEGDKVTLRNRSYDTEGATLTSTWKICKRPVGECSLTAATFDSASNPNIVTLTGLTHPIFIFSDEGSYDACLRVSDGDASAIICDGGTASDGFQVPSLLVNNAAPKVNALNLEVLPGKPATAIGRFVDPGWRDQHTGNVALPGLTVNTAIQEENVPAFATGQVTGSFDVPSGMAPGTINGSLSVQDGDGGSSSDNFQVAVLAANAEIREPNGTIDPAPVLESGAAYIGFIQSVGDIDIYQVVLNGAPLPQRGELLVTLRGLAGDLPTDLDLVVLAKPPAGVQASSFLDSTFLDSSFLDSTFLDSSFLDSTFLDSSFLDSPFLDSSFLDSPFLDSSFLDSPFLDSSFLDSSLRDSTFLDSQFGRFALADLGFAVPETNLGGADIGPDELGLGGIGSQNVRIAGYSANRGLAPEKVWTVSAIAGTEFYVAVAGANGAFSSAEPYVLQIETSVPPDLSQIHGTAACSGTPVVTWTGGGSSQATVLHNVSSPQTLFVTQRERMRALYNLDITAWNALQADLNSLADHDKVRGKIISMDRDADRAAFDFWDSHPCSVGAANEVAAGVRTEILAQLAANPTIKYVVIIGDDKIIPFHRAVDRTIIGNEKLYVAGSLLKPSSPIYASLQGGFVLEQDYLVSSNPLAYEGGELYTPDRPIGRMAETPGQIRAQAQAFLASNGSLNPASASTDLLVTGYDFFSDGADAVAGALASQFTPTTLIDPPTQWTASDVRCKFLGVGVGCSVPGLSFLTGHMSHFSHLSAAGFAGLPGETTRTSEVPAAGANFAWLAISMGCHAGLNVHDGDAFLPTGLGFDPNRDWVQAIQTAIYVAPTGFGYGDSDLILGNELLLVQIAEQLSQGNISAGQAILAAKLHYLQRTVLTDYDYKSIAEMTMYGLPMYDVQMPAAAQAASAATLTAAQSGVPAGTLNLAITERGGANPPVNQSLPITRQSTSRGDYFTLDGESQVTPGRPTQPLHVYDIPDDTTPTNPPGDVHGVFLTGGAFTAFGEFNPVIGTPSGLRGSPKESQVCMDAYWPAFVASGSNIGGDQKLNILGGQFRCTGTTGPSGQVVGSEWVYTAMNLELLRSTSEDKTPPDITSIDIRLTDPATNAAAITLRARGGDVAEIVLLVINEATGHITSVNRTFSDTGPYTVDVPNVGPNVSLLIQSRDSSNNVTYNTIKGANARVMRVDAGPDLLYTPGVPVTFQTKIYSFSNLRAPVSFTLGFGDGSGTSGTVTGTPAADGSLTFGLQHTYGASAPDVMTATVKVTDSNGAIGVDDVTVRRRCDPTGDATNPDADLVFCRTENDAGSVTFTMRVMGKISSAYQYRVNLDNGKVIRYADGQLTGFKSLQAAISPDGQELRIIVSWPDLGVKAGDHVRWRAEAQAGVQAQPVGFDDRMPDSGFLDYVVK